jgi:gas vesicle protein/phage tail protein X
MGQDPAVIRKEIERTREHMGDTVDALGYKADVPARAKDSVSEKVDALKSRITGVGSQVAEATPDAGEVGQGVQQAVGIVQENPLGLAIGAAAVGFLAGTLIPGTNIEDERIGPMADQLKQQARDTGQEALRHGKEIAQETAETAAEKAQEAVAEVQGKAEESAQSHAQDMAESTKHAAEQMRSDVAR